MNPNNTNNNNNMESEFGFDEYIMPNTFTTIPKVEQFDAQLYPSGFSYYGENNGFDNFSQTTVLMTPSSYEVYPNQLVQQQGLSSPESMSSRLSPPVMSTPLLSPSNNPNISSSITEKIANVNKLPESFLPEFHQYSKETYENGSSTNRKRRRNNSANQQSKKTKSNNEDSDIAASNNNSSSDNDDDVDTLSAQEVRRQIHIQSEQKRRAQIKDGFEELRQHLPGCVNKKMSKAALLHRTVQHLQHLKRNQTSLLAELERMMKENEQLKKFQESVLQKQALERMYQIGM